MDRRASTGEVAPCPLKATVGTSSCSFAALVRVFGNLQSAIAPFLNYSSDKRYSTLSGIRSTLIGAL